VKSQAYCSFSRMCHVQLLLDMTHCVLELYWSETAISASQSMMYLQEPPVEEFSKNDSVINSSNLLGNRSCPTVTAVILAQVVTLK